MKAWLISVASDVFFASVHGIETAPLSQADCPAMPIVEIVHGRAEIADGYHRIAGMIAAGERIIDCLTCDDDAVLGAAANAEQPDAQGIALAAIYAAYAGE